MTDLLAPLADIITVLASADPDIVERALDNIDTVDDHLWTTENGQTYLGIWIKRTTDEER